MFELTPTIVINCSCELLEVRPVILSNYLIKLWSTLYVHRGKCIICVVVGGTDIEHHSVYNTPLFNNTPTSPWLGIFPTRDYFQYGILERVSIYSEQDKPAFLRKPKRIMKLHR